MLELLLIAIPLALGLVTLACPKSSRLPRRILLMTALLHTAGIIMLLSGKNILLLPLWLKADGAGIIVCTIASLLFLAAVMHGNMWIPAAEKFESKHGHVMPEKYFCALLNAFLAMMSMAAFSRNFGLLWVAVEATTLFSAPLIIYHRSASSLEAMWKYLLICSAGIGLALFGTYLLNIAFLQKGSVPPGLDMDALAALSGKANPIWFKAAFLFCFAGYGLKMGLAPFHTWLPDAHSEAPSMVSVLLSGALLNCSFLGIMRVIAIAPRNLTNFCNEILIAFGILSLLAAAVFMIGQTDYKRLLAYSSVEHMGLLSLFLGLGAEKMLFIHLTFHSLIKMILFLTAGNFLLAFGTRKIASVRGTYALMPRTAFLWVTAVLLICGMPPSPLFLTEVRLVMEAGPILGSIILLLLFAVFAAMTDSALKMTGGKTVLIPEKEASSAAEKLSVLPMLLLIVPVLAGIRLLAAWMGGIL